MTRYWAEVNRPKVGRAPLEPRMVRLKVLMGLTLTGRFYGVQLLLLLLHIFFDLVHKYRVDAFLHGWQDAEHTVELRNLDQFQGMVG